MLSFVDNGYTGLKDYMTMHADYDSDESYSDKNDNLTPKKFHEREKKKPPLPSQVPAAKNRDNKNATFFLLLMCLLLFLSCITSIKPNKKTKT
jgi:hypothetical protein